MGGNPKLGDPQVAARHGDRSSADAHGHPIAGALWVTAGMAFLAGMAGLGRYCALEGLDPSQVLFFRVAFCVLFLLPMLAWRGSELYATTKFHLYGLRVGLSFVSMLAMFHAIALIPIGEVTAIGFLTPIFATVFAVLMLGERVRQRRVIALVVGFIGAMILLRPTTSTFGLGQIAALVSACALGIIGPVVKKLTFTDHPDRVVFLTNLLLLPLTLIPALFVWQWPPDHLWLFLAGMGLAALLGHMALVRGYTVAEASFVQMFKFTRLPFAVLIGFLAFGEALDALAWLGAAIIFGASIYVTRREVQEKAAANGGVPPAI